MSRPPPDPAEPRLPWCLDCRYDLSGLTLRDRAVTCPECGRINRVAEIRARLQTYPFAQDLALMVAPATIAACIAAVAALAEPVLGRRTPLIMAAAIATAAVCAVAMPPAVMLRRRAVFPLRGLTIADEVMTGIIASLLVIALIVLTASALRWG